MRFVYADSLDYVDPGYDFLQDRNAPGRQAYWDDLYPHEILDRPPYDGILVSRGIVGDRGGGKYTETQAMRFRRVGARAFLRLEDLRFRHLALFGDCGAFTYSKEREPPYTPEDMLAFYEDAGFDHGCSVDHIIFDFEPILVGMDGGSTEARRRFDITLANAEAFLKASRRLGNHFTPLGVVQGWSPGSMAVAAERLVAMGYRYLAVGGTVPLKSEQIHQCLRAIRGTIPAEVRLHILGFAKADDIHEFQAYGIESFDSASPMIRAFKDARANYYLNASNGRILYYTAIRIPQADESPKLRHLIKRGSFRQEDLRTLESKALTSLRAYGRRKASLEEALEEVLNYAEPALFGEVAEQRRRVKRQDLAARYRRTLEDRPWEKCACAICRALASRSFSSAPATGTSVAASTTSRSSTIVFNNSRVEQSLTRETMGRLSYSAIRARQSDRHQVLTFAAPAADVPRFARIDRIGRDEDGELRGFQRPQIAAHIREIQDYLEAANAVLPNPIVVAFTEGIDVENIDDGICRIVVDLDKGPPGLVVDGQQRLAALMNVNAKPFEVFVAALVCPDEAELRRQFVLINNTRPLPKSLIYELLPRVDGLPHRLSARARASALTDRMNYERESSLRGLIRQHTNPTGIISDTAIQRVFMNSLSDGLMREFIRRPVGGEETCYRLASEFYLAVQRVFAEAWWRDRSRGVMHTPKTSRLIHGAGIVALGHVMELLALLEGARTCDEFARGLGCLDGRTAWTGGHWRFSDDDVRRWNTLQNVDRDIRILAGYLVGLVRADIRRRRSDTQAAAEGAPTIKSAAGGAG